MNPQLDDSDLQPLMASLGATLDYDRRHPFASIDVVAPARWPCLVIVLFRVRVQIGWLVV